MYFTSPWNSSAILVLLGFVHLSAPIQIAVLPSGLPLSRLPAISESFTFFSCAAWTYVPTCKIKSPLPLSSDSSHFIFNLIVTAESQVIFCWAVLTLLGHYVLLIWGMRKRCEHQFLLQLLFNRGLSETEKTNSSQCFPMIKDKNESVLLRTSF